MRRRDVETAIADGFADVELLKRRTGAGTGPCQGKLCHGEMLACLADLPTVITALLTSSMRRRSASIA